MAQNTTMGSSGAQVSLVKNVSRFRVSSVMNKDVKQFGKKNLFDGDDETCWNSDQGSPQWVLLEFDTEVSVTSVHIQFQGGFSGKECILESTSSDNKAFTQFHSFYPQDTNSIQVFDLPEPHMLKNLKVVFKDSTDFFGRITIYKLDILGSS